MTDLIRIPDIGKKMAGHLVDIGYSDIKSLKEQDPEEIFAKHRLLYGPGTQSCKCALYCYRLAVYYADHGGELPPDKQGRGEWKKPL